MIKTHPVFKGLTFDEYLNWYECPMFVKGKEVDFCISMDAVANEALHFEQSVAFYNKIDHFAEEAERCIIAGLLPELNNGWFPEDHEPVTESKFREYLKLTEVTVYAHGKFEFFYRTGALFSDHSIIVSGSIAGGTLSASLAG